MEVTSTRIHLEEVGRMKAYASIVLEDAFVIHGIRIIEGNNGLFVAMPSKRDRKEEFSDIAHPINQIMRDKVNVAVLDAYEESTNEKLSDEKTKED